jgi:hypothetical protein
MMSEINSQEHSHLSKNGTMKRLYFISLLAVIFGFFLFPTIAVGGQYYNYYGCEMYCEFSGCLNASERNFWRYCNIEHPTLPVEIPGWSMAQRNICNEPITGAWYCCRAEAAGDSLPAIPSNLKGCGVIVGSWIWYSGGQVVFSKWGRCSAKGWTGEWKCLDPSGRFEIRWTSDGGPKDEAIDTVNIKGDNMSGRNQYGKRVTAIRKQ